MKKFLVISTIGVLAIIIAMTPTFVTASYAQALGGEQLALANRATDLASTRSFSSYTVDEEALAGGREALGTEQPALEAGQQALGATGLEVPLPTCLTCAANVPSSLDRP
jgi:hypothetical protein